MKALHFSQHGNVDELRYGEIPTPNITAKDVLIRVKACALNHLDLWVLKGWPGLSLPMPHVGGADVAGEIAGIGADVNGFTLGQMVVVQPGFLADGPADEWTEKGEESLSPRFHILGESCAGGFAEFVSVPAHAVFPKPSSLDFAEAAASLLVGVTAWRMLSSRAAVKASETVVIVGAGGGLNSFSIQVAKHLGANVIAITGTEEKAEKAKALGANNVINYKAQPQWAKEVKRLTSGRGADVVVDNVGKDTIMQSLHAAVRGGRIVTVGNTSGPQLTLDNRLLFAKQLSLLGSTMGSTKDFHAVLELLANRSLKPVIDCQMALADGRQAYERLEQGTQFGKIVLLP